MISGKLTVHLKKYNLQLYYIILREMLSLLMKYFLYCEKYFGTLK